MSLFRLLLLRRATATATLFPAPHSFLPLRTLAYSSAEEAAAERRRRKRRLRIEPPLHALRPPPDPSAPRLPDSTSSLVGPRLNLHNRVQSLIRAGDLDSASSLSRQSVFSRTRPTVFTCNALIAAMYRHDRHSDASSLFHFFFRQSNIVPNVVSYNFLIASLCSSSSVDDALAVYRQILSDSPFSPSSVTYRHLTKGLVDANRLPEALDLLREMLSKGHGADSLVYNNLILGFLDSGDLAKANELFDELKERCLVYDGAVSATFMDWFFKQGREREAMECYKELLDRKFRMTPVTCNVLLECLLKHGRGKEARELFDSMLDDHTPPSYQAVNSDTFNVMVNECFRAGRVEEAVEVFRKVGGKANSKAFAMDVAGYNNIIVRFAEIGRVEEAERFFEELRSKSLSPDVTGYRTLIDAYLKEKRAEDALQMFHLMVDANLRVIPEYANRWFGELVENDKVVESSQLLKKMGERDPKPDAVTYEIVIKGLCQMGAFDQCKELVGQMMGYGVGVTPTLRQFLLDVFEKEGQKDEVEKLLDPKMQGFGGRWQPNGGTPRPAAFPGPRFPQSAVSSGSGNKFGGHGQGENGPFERSYEYAGASGSVGLAGLAGGTGGGFTGSAHQAATPGGPMVHRGGQMENPRFPNEPAGFSRSAGQTGYTGSSTAQYAAQTGQTSPSGCYDNAGNQGAYEPPAGFSTQAAGSVRSPEPVGYHGGQMGYRGPTGQFAAQTGPSGHNIENARYQVGYEPAGFSAQSGSTRFPDQFAHQSGQWSQPGPWSHQNGPAQLGSTGYSQPAEPGQAGYTGSFDTANHR